MGKPLTAPLIFPRDHSCGAPVSMGTEESKKPQQHGRGWACGVPCRRGQFLSQRERVAALALQGKCSQPQLPSLGASRTRLLGRRHVTLQFCGAAVPFPD